MTEIKSDRGKSYIQTGKNDNLTAFYIPDFSYTMLGKFIIYRLKEDRDVKILITGKGKTTGTGKTTLAIQIARWINKVRNQLFNNDISWKAKKFAFMNVFEYLQKYKNSQKGDPLITDELEYMADRRRHQSKQNVKFSQAWSILRYKNVVTIGTAPGLVDLEKRIPEGADIWINVTRKGEANVYYLTFDDFTWEQIYRRMRIGNYRETICWSDLENDSDYIWLKNQKEEMGVPGIDDETGKEISESDMKQLERDLKNAHVKNLLHKLHNKDLESRFSQEDIADIAEVSQPQVSKIKREMEKEGEL